jgi:prefoldin subunit 5
VADGVQARRSHEERIAALEQSHVAIAAAQAATQKEITELRKDMFGDPSRQDNAGRGALVLLQESVTQSHNDLAAQIQRTTTQITSQFQAQTDSLGQRIQEVKDKLQKEEQTEAQKKEAKKNRRFQVLLYVGGGVAVAVASYLVGLLGGIHP